MNCKGQEFAGYKLLVAVIMVSMILLIILSIVSYLDSLRYLISERRLFEGLQNAVQTPDGSVIVRENLTFKEGTQFSNRAFAKKIGLQDNCVEIYSSPGSTAYINSNNKVIEVTSYIVTSVYFQCWKGHSNCDVFCGIYFGISP